MRPCGGTSPMVPRHYARQEASKEDPMGKQSDREKYLANCAKTFQGQLGLKPEQFKECKTFAEVVAILEKTKLGAIELRLKDAPAEQVGKLAYMRDHSRVERLAAEALIPSLAMHIMADLNPKRFVKCKFCEFKALKYSPRSPAGPVNGFEVMRGHITDNHPQEASSIVDHAYDGNEDERDETAA